MEGLPRRQGRSGDVMESGERTDVPRPKTGRTWLPSTRWRAASGARLGDPLLRGARSRAARPPGSAGRRWYGPDEIRRLAIILYWQRSGLMSLEEISDILAGPRRHPRLGPDRPGAHRDAAPAGRTHERDPRPSRARAVPSSRPASPPDGCHHYEEALVPTAIRLAGHDHVGRRYPRPPRVGQAADGRGEPTVRSIGRFGSSLRSGLSRQGGSRMRACQPACCRSATSRVPPT